MGGKRGCLGSELSVVTYHDYGYTREARVEVNP